MSAFHDAVDAAIKKYADELEAAVDEAMNTCACIPVDQLGGRITTHCPLHNPFERIARGEHVEFVGLAGVAGVEVVGLTDGADEKPENPDIGSDR